MKMVKKILLGLATTAVLFSISACKREAAGNAELISIGFGSSNGSIAYTNGGTTVTRGFKSLNTKHLDAICKIEMDVKALVGTEEKANGSMGYIFDIQGPTDGKYNFSIAAVRYNQQSSTNKYLEAYVETFKDVPAADLEKELTGGIHATGSVGSTTTTWNSTAYGFTLVPSANMSQVLNDGKITLWIDVVANDNSTSGRTGTAGTYSVRFFKADPQRKNGALTSCTHEYESSTATNDKLAEFTVAATNTSIDTTKSLTTWQSDIGCYANVYAGQTLNGKWTFSGIKKEAEEIVEY